MSNLVLVVGATGGVGQLVVAKLLEQAIRVRTLARTPEKVHQMFGDRVEIAIGDIRQPETLQAAMLGITHLIACTGTTAFPSKRWDFDLPAHLNGMQRIREWIKLYFDPSYRSVKARNSPQDIDAEGIRHLVAAAPRDLQRFVFVSSAGVQRKEQFPYSLLNAFGVLDAKWQGEVAVRESGLPYTIIRPGRLVDGPYTSYDLSTLLRTTSKVTRGIVMCEDDTLTGQTSRIDVASACVASLNHPALADKAIELVNAGQPSPDMNWTELFNQFA